MSPILIAFFTDTRMGDSALIRSWVVASPSRQPSSAVKTERSEALSREAGAPAKRVVALPVEGLLKPINWVPNPINCKEGRFMICSQAPIRRSGQGR